MTISAGTWRLTLTFLLLALCATGYSQSSDRAKLDQLFDRLDEKKKAMGSLLIVKDRQVIYRRTIGYGEITATEKKPLTDASRFRIGSITKMFTAVVVLQLVDEGKVKLTDTLDAYFPQVPNAKKITIAHLLAHRSGIPTVRRQADPQRKVSTLPMTKDERLALIVNAKPEFEPDARQGYSNSGFQLLGMIIEKVTGKAYEDVIAERIAARIGLKDTYVTTGAIDVTKHEALTYIHFGGDWTAVSETHPSALYSAGAIVSTPQDLATFIQALFDLKLTSQESLDRMKSVPDATGFGMGMGMESYLFAGKTFYGHAGGGDNYGAWLAYLPGEKLAVAYATNAKIYPVPDIIRSVVDIHYNQPVTLPTFESLAVSPEVLDRYVGTYVTADAPAKFVVTRQGATLFVQPPGQTTSAPVEAVAQDRFQLEGARAVFEFNPEKGQLTVKRRGAERVFTREQNK